MRTPAVFLWGVATPHGAMTSMYVSAARRRGRNFSALGFDCGFRGSGFEIVGLLNSVPICVAGAIEGTRYSNNAPGDTKHKRFCVARFLRHWRDGRVEAPSASQIVAWANEFCTAPDLGIEP